MTTTTNTTTAPSANRSTRGLRFLAGLALAAGSVAGAFATDAGATGSATPQPSATVSAPAVGRPAAPAKAPAASDRTTVIAAAPGTGAATVSESSARAVYRYMWGRVVWDPYTSYYSYFRNQCAYTVYPYSGALTVTASGGYRTYRCWLRIA